MFTNFTSLRSVCESTICATVALYSHNDGLRRVEAVRRLQTLPARYLGF